jgi:uncharacterized protein (DUF1330 family)
MLEMLVGLNITNQEEYSNYRKHMTPLLEKCGGGFGYDFKISEVLKSQTEDSINRLFTIHFPSEKEMDTFFSNEDYIQIKKDHFVDSVKSTTIISTYER